jgi:CHAD domain-containing protein
MPFSTSAPALLRRRVTVLHSRLPLALSGDVEGVHQARVASRRLREAVPVAASAVDPAVVATALKALRRVTRALGPVRELDVSLGCLRDLEARGAASPTAARMVAATLARERESRRVVLAHELRPKRLARLDASIDALLGRLDHAPAGGAWRPELARRLLTRSQALRRAIDEAGALYAVEALHEVRIAAKRLRYAIELAHEAKISGAARMVSRLKRVQDLLGHLHDLQVLGDWVRTAGLARPRTVAGLAAFIERECRRVHAAYVGRRARLVQLADDVVDDVVPRVEHPTAPAADSV